MHTLKALVLKANINKADSQIQPTSGQVFIHVENRNAQLQTDTRMAGIILSRSFTMTITARIPQKWK